MAINLDEHAVFIDRLQMEMVPLSVAKQAVQEAVNSTNDIANAMETINKSLSEINKTMDPDD